MKKSIKEWVVIILIAILVIGLIMMVSKWRSGEYDGTVMDELVPAILIGLFIAWMVLLIVSNIFKNSPTLWFVASGIAFLATIGYRVLHISSSIGLYIVITIMVILMAMVLVMWIGEKK